MSHESIVVTVSPDRYSATLTLKDDQPVSAEAIVDALKQKGVVFGIRREVLRLVIENQRQGNLAHEVVVAQGVKPVPGAPAKVDYQFEISTKPKEDESGRVDYREISTVIQVETQQLLAIKRKLREPINGITVTGERTEFPPASDIPLHAGENVSEDEQENTIFYRSLVEGALTFHNQTLSVNPILSIERDVDFSTGNLRFNGDIKITRDVLPDFIIEASGTISIWGSAIACHLHAGKDILIRSGIVGKGKGTAQAAGDIQATFVENAQVSAQKNILIRNGLIGSQVSCGGTLLVEALRSRIVGSSIRAGQGITAYDAGSRFDSDTSLTTGYAPEQEQEYETVRVAFEHKIQEVRDLEKKYGKTSLQTRTFPRGLQERGVADAEKWQILRQEIQETHQMLKDAEASIYNHKATIRIKGTLYPRVHLKIGRYETTTSREYTNVTVRYNEEEDRLVIG